MEGKQIRFGIMGCARIATKISKAIFLSPNTSLRAIASRSINKAKIFALENNFPSSVKIYGDYESLLEDPDIHAVYIPLPTTLHVRWAVLAAGRKKHVLLEKPAAINVSELDKILEACEVNGVQFMDGTMWMHHPRTAKMKEIFSDERKFGLVKVLHSFASFNMGPEFLKNDIRVNPNLDSLGALGDLGWYCIRVFLWSVDYELPKTVVALRGTDFNEAGVILSCGASLIWEDGRVATFNCSFVTCFHFDTTIIGTKGCLCLHDIIVPFKENCGSFNVSLEGDFGMPAEMLECNVETEFAQEVLMVREFGDLVGQIEWSGGKTENFWSSICRKTQLVLDAVKASIDSNYEPIEIGN